MPSVGVHYVVCGQLCFSSTRKAISVECKVNIIHQMHKCDVFNEDWMWLDADKDANFSSCTSVDNKLATHAISSYMYELWVDCVGDSSSDKKRETRLTFNHC